MDLTSTDTVLPRPLPSATNLSPFLYESTGGRRNRKNKTRKNKTRNTRKNKRGYKKRTYRR